MGVICFYVFFPSQTAHPESRLLPTCAVSGPPESSPVSGVEAQQEVVALFCLSGSTGYFFIMGGILFAVFHWDLLKSFEYENNIERVLKLENQKFLLSHSPLLNPCFLAL